VSLTRQFDEFFYFSRKTIFLNRPDIQTVQLASLTVVVLFDRILESRHWYHPSSSSFLFFFHTKVRKDLLSNSISTAAVTLLGNGKLDTLALGEGDPGLVLTNDENVGFTGSEGVVNGILDVDNVETTVVALTVGDDTDTTHVTTTGDHGDDTSVELDEVGDLAGSKVDLDSVVDLDQGVGVADAIVQN
jgi:hypothetical protein